MYKKILTTAFAITLSAACALCATACSNDVENENNNEPVLTVTEDQWKTAFDKVNTAENYTAEVTMDMQNSDNGVQKVFTYFNTDIILMQNKSYQDNNEITLEKYYIKENTDNYCISNNPENGDNWIGIKQDGLFATAIQQSVPYAKQEFAKSGSTEFLLLKDLYSEFAYNDGEYNATSFYVKNLPGVSYDITIKFSDGELTCLSIVGENPSTSIKNSIIIEFSDYGKTSVTLPAPAQEAFDKIKKENN